MQTIHANKHKPQARQDFIQRQALLGLLFAQAGAVLLHLQRLPIWLVLLAVVVFIWRIQIFRSQWAFPSRLIRTCLVLCSIAAVIAYYREWYALEPMVTLLVIAFLLKLLEVERRRDGVILTFVGFFVTASAFLFDQGIITTILGIVVLWLLTACLLVLHGSQSHYLSRRTTRTISILLIQAVPLMLLMLFVFPRVGALWSVPLKSSSAVTGVSDTMAPGDFSQLTRSRALAFRVSFENNQAPPPAQRYWRGLVLTQFDGRSWSRQDFTGAKSRLGQSALAPQPSAIKIQGQAQSLRYDIVLETTNTRWLYGIPYAQVLNNLSENKIDSDVSRSPTNELLLNKPVTQRIQYAVNSILQPAQQESSENLRQARLLPRGFNPRTIEMARQWYSQAASSEDYIERVLRFYNQNFTYTLSPPKLGLNTADEFLFSSQRGFCEHFSSSFVILMRAVGIPARVVTGYQGGEWNADDQYLLVRQYDAHAWAEVWLPERGGWTRVDPTAAVAPNRIEQGLLDTLAEEEQSLMDARVLPSFAWINQLALKWDSLNYDWQRWALSYDQEKQSEWLKKILGEVTATRMAILLVAPGMLMLTFFGLMAIRDKRKPTAKKVKLYHYLLKRLKRKNLHVDVKDSDTFGQIFSQVISQNPEKKIQLRQLESAFNSIFYRNNSDLSQQEFLQIKKVINEL